MAAAEEQLDALGERVHREFEMLAYPASDWVEPVLDAEGRRVYEVVIVGAGQSGMAAAQGLIRDGITNILIIDRSPEGSEGPWQTYARMAYLRTPKYLVGMEHGLPSLSTRAWYEAKHGVGSWESVDRVGREEWMEYLRWYRKVLRLPVRNGVELVDIAPATRWLDLSVESESGRETLRARRVVLATGYEGAGEWRIPPAIAAALPAGRCFHSNTVIDFAPFRDKRVGILGHGASAFDAAITALGNGARSVDLCFRRPAIPSVNPHRWIEFVGFLKHFPDLDDSVRWSVNHYFDAVCQPPARHSYQTAQTYPNFAMHAGAPWLAVGMEGDAIRVETPRRTFAFDLVICATGSMVDLPARRELRSVVADIALWRHRYAPPPEEAHDTLGLFPYLGRYYELQELAPGAAPLLDRIYAFNFSGIVSMGPHSTSISGHKYSVPRLVRGITRSLFLEQQNRLMTGLRAYDERELDWPPPALGDRQSAAE